MCIFFFLNNLDTTHLDSCIAVLIYNMHLYLLLLAVITGFFGRESRDGLITIEQVSMVKAMGIQHPTFSETESLFPGKGNKDEKAFLLEFGISSDLKTGVECSDSQLKTLLMDLRLKLVPYFSLKGQVMSLKKKSDSTENQDEIESSLETLKAAKADVTKILNKAFACIAVKTVSRYKNATMSQNHFDCTMHSYIYYSSMKKLSKKLIAMLEETFDSFTKSKQYCKLTHMDVNLPTCSYLQYSFKAVKDMTAIQTSHFFQYKRIKKRCKYFINFQIYTLFKR